MDVAAFAAHLPFQEFAVHEAAHEACQTPIAHNSQTRPIEARARALTLPQDLKTLVHRLPTTFEHVPHVAFQILTRMGRNP